MLTELEAKDIIVRQYRSYKQRKHEYARAATWAHGTEGTVTLTMVKKLTEGRLVSTGELYKRGYAPLVGERRNGCGLLGINTSFKAISGESIDNYNGCLGYAYQTIERLDIKSLAIQLNEECDKFIVKYSDPSQQHLYNYNLEVQNISKVANIIRLFADLSKVNDGKIYAKLEKIQEIYQLHCRSNLLFESVLSQISLRCAGVSDNNKSMDDFFYSFVPKNIIENISEEDVSLFKKGYEGYFEGDQADKQSFNFTINIPERTIQQLLILPYAKHGLVGCHMLISLFEIYIQCKIHHKDRGLIEKFCKELNKYSQYFQEMNESIRTPLMQPYEDKLTDLDRKRIIDSGTNTIPLILIANVVISDYRTGTGEKVITSTPSIGHEIRCLLTDENSKTNLIKLLKELNIHNKVFVLTFSEFDKIKDFSLQSRHILSREVPEIIRDINQEEKETSAAKDCDSKGSTDRYQKQSSLIMSFLYNSFRIACDMVEDIYPQMRP